MKGDGVVVLRSGLVVFQRVRLVHEHQVVLLGHHVRAHRLLVATAVLGEGEQRLSVSNSVFCVPVATFQARIRGRSAFSDARVQFKAVRLQPVQVPSSFC